jgi:pimeloyl-ACP methyl ester carboxylesterase
MAHFVLIHGAMHGSWCWEKIVPRLESAGHRVTAPDLPAMAPNDPVSARDVTLALLGEYVANTVRTIAESVVLVGHSMVGIAIIEGAQRAPERVAGLVYLSALLVPANKTMFDLIQEGGHSIDISTVSDDGTVLFCNKANARQVFYNTSDEKDVQRALSRLMPQPLKPGLEALTITPDRFGHVPRAYIECTRDNALPLDFQRRMQRALPCDPVLTLDTDHSPFFSAPDGLTKHLMTIANVFVKA